MQDEPYFRIPLYRRDGSIRTYALVDEADRELVSGYRWVYTAGGYVTAIRIEDGVRTYYRLHRVIMGLARSEKDDPRVPDHINRDKLDNRRANLRILPGRGANCQNRGATGRSKCRGVDFNKGKWRARGVLPFDPATDTTRGKLVHLGYFATEAEAAQVALDFRRKHLPYAVD